MKNLNEKVQTCDQSINLVKSAFTMLENETSKSLRNSQAESQTAIDQLENNVVEMQEEMEKKISTNEQYMKQIITLDTIVKKDIEEQKQKIDALDLESADVRKLLTSLKKNEQDLKEWFQKDIESKIQQIQVDQDEKLKLAEDTNQYIMDQKIDELHERLDQNMELCKENSL